VKKKLVWISLAVIAAAVLTLVSENMAQELRPTQKIMQARAAWMGSMIENLGKNKFDVVARDAGELAAQTQKAGENHPNPLGKELTLAIASLAGEISTAAAKQDGETVKAKLEAIKGNCGECHAKIRDKK
jgi:hypothetical protein